MIIPKIKNLKAKLNIFNDLRLNIFNFNNSFNKKNVTIHNNRDYLSDLEAKLKMFDKLYGKKETIPYDDFYDAEQLYWHTKQQHPTHQYIKDFESLARTYYRHLISDAKQKNSDFSIYQKALKRFSKEER
jgi:hypothetical protein